MMSYLRAAGWVVWKDLQHEWRTRQSLGSMFLFGLLMVVIFGFAFDPLRAPAEVQRLFAGILWSTVLFAGLLGIGRSFQQETQGGAWQALLLAPVDRSAVYVGKVAVNTAFLLLVQAVAVPLFFIFLGQPAPEAPGLLALLFVLASFGFVAIGTFLAALVQLTGLSDLLFPLILFPIAVPLLIAAVRATEAVLATGPAGDIGWIGVLLVFNAVYFFVPLLLFDFLLEV